MAWKMWRRWPHAAGVLPEGSNLRPNFESSALGEERRGMKDLSWMLLSCIY